MLLDWAKINKAMLLGFDTGRLVSFYNWQTGRLLITGRLITDQWLRDEQLMMRLWQFRVKDTSKTLLNNLQNDLFLQN